MSIISDARSSTTSLSSSRLAWLPATLLALGSIVATVWLVLQPKAPHGLLLVFPPWWSQEEAFRAAGTTGAAVIGAGPWPNTVVVGPDGQSSSAALHAAGVWLLLDPTIPGACAGSTGDPS